MAKLNEIDSLINNYYLSDEIVPKELYSKDQEVRTQLRSIEYKIFKTKNPSTFSKIVTFGSDTIGKVVKFSINKESEKKINTTLYLLGLDFDAKSLYGFSIFCLFGFFLLGIIVAVVGLLIPGLVLMVLGVISLFAVQTYPSRELQIRMSKSSSDLVTFILYLIIFMRQTPNLEGAVNFASDNLNTYLAYDLKKLIWDTAARKYVNIKEALDEYGKRWAKTSPAFTNALFLVESSVFQKTEEERLALLEEASQQILNGTFESMRAYANSLKEPLNMVYMLGMVLPVLGLVLAPMMMAFVEIPDFGLLLFLMYDIGLPLMIYFLIRNKLTTRPAGFAAPDLNLIPDLPKLGHFFIKIGSKKVPVNALIPAAAVFILFNLPVYLLLPVLMVFSPNQVYISLLITAGIGMGLYTYFKLSVVQLKSAAEELNQIQHSFSAAAFQMGSFLSQGYPPETTILKVSATMKNTPVSEFFNIVANNVQNVGMSLKDAIFDKVNGAIRFFPSPMLIAAMRVFIESAQKSIVNSAAAMLYISRHLTNLQRIDEQVRNLLDETTSGMRVEVGLLSPVMSGIVVGLTTLIGSVLRSLSSSISTITSGLSGSSGSGLTDVIPFAFGIFNLSGGAVPLYTFQIVIGIYLITLSIIIGYSIATISQPGDKVEMFDKIASTVLISIILYVIVTFFVTLVFASIGGTVLALTHLV